MQMFTFNLRGGGAGGAVEGGLKFKDSSGFVVMSELTLLRAPPAQRTRLRQRNYKIKLKPLLCRNQCFHTGSDS